MGSRHRLPILIGGVYWGMRLAPALLACALLGCATTHAPKPATGPTEGSATVTPTATAPASFVRTTAEAPAMRNVEVRDGLTHQQAMRTLIDGLSERYVVDVVDPRAGFAMTTWQANLMREGVPDLHYRTRVVARFVDDWHSLQLRSEARWARGEEADIGYDVAQLDSIAAVMRGKLGKKP
jgi:glucose/arabinose dehydrogenase